MAFGDLKGGAGLNNNAASITNPCSVTGSIAVNAGDLIYAVIGEQTSLTVTACGDNLHGGSTYTATNAGTDSGTSTGRAFYKRVTVPGTLTSVDFVATASSDNVAAVVAVFEGPFDSTPIDANPANVQDIASAFLCPATGTLVQANELVIGWAVATGSTVWSATSPNTSEASLQVATVNVLHTIIGHQVVAATTTLQPAFTAGSNPTDSVLGTNSFKLDLNIVQGSTWYLTRSQWRVPRTHLRNFSVQQTFQDDTSLARNPFRLVRSFNKLKYKHDSTWSTPTDVGGGGPSTQTLTPSLYANTNTFYVPTVSLQELPAGSVPEPRRRKRKLPVPRTHLRDFSVSPFLPLLDETALVRAPFLLRRSFNKPKYKHDNTQGIPLDTGVTSQTLTPSLYTNTNTFYTSVVNLQELPAAAFPSPRRRVLPIPRYKNENVSGSISFDQTLTPSLYTNINTFYVPLVTLQEFPAFNIYPTKRLPPSRRRIDRSFTFTIGADQTLTPSLYTNTNIFYVPTVTAGVVALNPSLYINANTFYTPLVTLQEFPSFNIFPVKKQSPTKIHRDHSVRATYIFEQTLTPDLFTNDNTFYSPIVMREGANLLPSTYNNTNVFYTPTITTSSVELAPSLFTNTDTFYSPTISLQELPTSAVAPIRRRIRPRRYIDPSSSGTQLAVAILHPSLYVNADTFYTSVVSSTYTLHPDLFTNDNTFYTPIVIEGQALHPSLYTNSNTFYVPVITQGPATLSLSLYINTSIFYRPTISVIVPPPPTIVGGVVGQGYRPPRVVNVTTNGILFTIPITILPGAATTISLLPGKARINVTPEIRPFMNNVETNFTVVGTAKGTDILEDNMDDLMLILSQILLD